MNPLDEVILKCQQDKEAPHVVLVFNYPDGCEEARKRQWDAAARIQGKHAYVLACSPKYGMNAVDQVVFDKLPREAVLVTPGSECPAVDVPAVSEPSFTVRTEHVPVTKMHAVFDEAPGLPATASPQFADLFVNGAKTYRYEPDAEPGRNPVPSADTPGGKELSERIADDGRNGLFVRPSADVLRVVRPTAGDALRDRASWLRDQASRLEALASFADSLPVSGPAEAMLHELALDYGRKM